VSFNTLLLSSEIAAALLLALLDLALISVFLHAYTRCRRGSLLLLAAGTVGFVYMNLFSVVLLLYPLAQLKVFSAPMMRLLSAFYPGAAIAGGVAWFVGAFLLIRFTLSLYASQKT
jgi:hypothetical protein